MMMIDFTTGWFKIVKIPTFGLNKTAISNDEYIDESSDGVSQLFNNTWLYR